MNNKFLQSTYNKPANKLLLNVLRNFSFDKNSYALELGCGSGSDVNLLLEKGFVVDAVDKDSNVTEYLPKHKCLHFHNVSFEEFLPKKNYYDLINAQWSLSFCKPEHFPDFWNRLTKSLKQNGIFVGNFFGLSDEWNENMNMTFLSRENLQELFYDFKIISIEEKEYDGKLVVGGRKHWHILEVVAINTSKSC